MEPYSQKPISRARCQPPLDSACPSGVGLNWCCSGGFLIKPEPKALGCTSSLPLLFSARHGSFSFSRIGNWFDKESLIFVQTFWRFGFVWRGQMRIITCRIGCISPRRQARGRRSLQTPQWPVYIFTNGTPPTTWPFSVTTDWKKP